MGYDCHSGQDRDNPPSGSAIPPFTRPRKPFRAKVHGRFGQRRMTASDGLRRPLRTRPRKPSGQGCDTPFHETAKTASGGVHGHFGRVTTTVPDKTATTLRAGVRYPFHKTATTAPILKRCSFPALLPRTKKGAALRRAPPYGRYETTRAYFTSSNLTILDYKYFSIT